jgi:hypothetical protein
MKLVRLIKTRLNETYSKARIGKNLSDAFPTQNGLKQGDALLLLLFNFPLEYGIRRVQENQEGSESNRTHLLLFYTDDFCILEENVNTIKKHTKSLLEAITRMI